MASLNSITSKFEELPDEILLLICRYLSSVDILFSFYDLNSRLSQTISGFCRHVVLAQVPFARFNYICTSILPDIGANICSLVVGNDWKGVLSKIFLSYFGEKMSLAFPHLKHLLLNTFRIDPLMSFLDCLQNLPELFELKMMNLYEIDIRSPELNILLHRIFTVNNNRLTSILFDDDSLSFSYENKNDICYPHIEKLVIKLKTLTDLHRLLTVLPQLKFIDAAINEGYFEVHEEIQYIPILTLKHFHLRSFGHRWNLDGLSSILKRIPNVQELIVEISTNRDTRLIDGQQIFSRLSSLPLTKFSYFLQFEDSSSLDDTNILSSWQQFNQEFICFKSDDDDTLVLYTLPVNISHLVLRYPVAKNKIFSDNYCSQVKSLTLSEVSTRMAETFFIIAKCHQMHQLILQVDETIAPKSFQQIQLCKLPYLTIFVAFAKSSVNADDFKKLLEVSPNLYHLAINYEFIKPLFDSESVCHFLEHRITHLLISVSSIRSIESATASISRLTSVFPSLKYLWFHIGINNQSVEPLILNVFHHLCKWNHLVSFGVVNIKMDSTILTKGIREWVLENSLLNDNDPFLTDYSAKTFRLWL